MIIYRSTGDQMQKFLSKLLYFTGTATACLMMIFTTGCASGGWELTRDYSVWINSKKTVLRVVLYILTIPVFLITILIDTVVNNTIDFWRGKVSDGTTTVFHKDNKSFFVTHEILTGDLKRSTIIVKEGEKLLQTVVLSETQKHEIELSVDGVVRTRVGNIENALPLLSSFDKNGKMIEQKNLHLEDTAVAQN